MNLSRLNNHTTFLLSGIIILAFVLRLYNLNFQSLWVDEIISMIEGDPELSLRTAIGKTIYDQPPAYFILLHSWFKIVNYTEFNGRLLSVLIGIACVIAMFFLGKEVKDKNLGLLASFLTAINYLSIYFSQEIRFYSFLFLFTCLSYLFFIKCVKHSRVADFIIYTILTIIVLYSHYYGLVVIASQGLIFVALLIFYSFSRKFVILSIGSGILIAIAFLPWMPVIFSDITTSNFWIEQVSFYFPLEYFYVYFKDILACCVFALLILYYFFNRFVQLKEKRYLDPTSLIIAGWGILSFLIPLSYSLIRIPMLHVRYTIIALPALIIIISLGFYLIKEKTRLILLAVTTCSTLISLIFIEKYYTKVQKEDWRGMIAQVAAEASPTDVLVSEYAQYCNYYLKVYKSNLNVEGPDNFTVTEKPERVWWIEGFALHDTPTAAEQMLLNNGYILQKQNDLFNTRSRLYMLPKTP